MTYLIDTDTMIRAIRGESSSASFISSSTTDGISISVITYGEVLEGLLHSQRGSGAQRARFYAFVDSITVLDIGLAEVHQFAQIRLALRTQGMLIPDNDIWIAATAPSHDLQLVSGDQHFRRIEGLRVYSP